MFWQIGPRPRLRLAHTVDTTVTHSYVRTTQQIWPIPITRPHRGTATGTAVCGTCGEEFHLRLLDYRATRIRQLVWAILALLGWASFVLAAYLIATAPVVDELRPGPEGPPGGLLFAGIFGGFLTGAVFTPAFYREDGTRRVRGTPWAKGHALRT